MRQVTAADIDAENDIGLARLLFWEFCLFYDNGFFTGRPFLEKVADVFQYIYDEYKQGRAATGSISLPPRSGKSYITSLFCAWWLGNLPELSVMRNSCTTRLYEKFSYDVRNVVRSAKFAAVFPEAVLADDKQNISGWNLTKAKQVSYFGSGVGGTIIGFGANIAITDDLYAGMDDALSPNYNEKLQMWLEGTHGSRMEKNCPEIFIGTRWSKNDVIGKAVESGRVNKAISQPALIQSPTDPTQFISFCEDVKTTDEYLKKKKEIEDIIWEAEYMQEPIEAKGLLFPKSELKFYNPATVDVDKMSVFRLGVIDPANEGGDDLAAPAGYLIEDKIYIHDVIYNNDGTDVNEGPVVEWIRSNKLNGVRFEGNSAWYLFGQMLRRRLQESKSNCTFRIINNHENKHTRILAQAAFIRNHFVFRSDWEQIPQYRKFMQNLTAYLKTGGAKHDDAPDAAAELAKYFQEHYKNLW
jgi:predicted phage terminase large subunit-like protein